MKYVSYRFVSKTAWFWLKPSILTSDIHSKFWEIFMRYMMNILRALSIQIFLKLIYWIYWQVEGDCKTRISIEQLEGKGNWWHSFISADKIMKIFGHVADMCVMGHKYRFSHDVASFHWAGFTNMCLSKLYEILVYVMQPK